ncbi:MAG: CDP-alcohol phosphatidyltransferase family protein [Candidatus Binatia bacterium]
MIDPANRWYRYPLSERVVGVLVRSTITPNQVTFAHTVAGVAAALAVAWGTAPALLVAAVLWEIHLLLDCLDGLLARRRGTASAYGHTIDIIGDSVAYVALAVAMWGYLRAADPDGQAGTLILAMAVSGALAAWAHDFYSRKLTAALMTGTDSVYGDLYAKRRPSGFVGWFGWVFTWLQILGLTPGSLVDLVRRVRADAPPPAPWESSEVLAIAGAADGDPARRAFRAVGLMSNDNCVALLGLGLLIGHIRAAIVVATVYAMVTLLAGIALCQVFLGAARREFSLARGRETTG